MSYEPYVPPPGVNAGPSTAPRLGAATDYVAPGTPRADGTRPRSHIEVGYAHLFDGRESYLASRCLREVLGLRVETVRDVLYLDLEILDAALVAAEAREAQRVADVRAPRLARVAAAEISVTEAKAARKSHVKNVLPARRALADALGKAMRELDPESVFLKAIEALESEVEAPLRELDNDVFAAEYELELAQAHAAEPVPAERFDVLRLQANPRGWLPDVIDLLRAVRTDIQKQRAAHVARVRADLQLAGVL